MNDYTLIYELYLAEEEMNDHLLDYCGLMAESVGLITIQEGVKETILNYLTRIAQAISSAFDKFKRGFIMKKDLTYLKSIKGKVDNFQGSFTAHNWIDFDAELINSIKIEPFNYEAMKDYLDQQKNFMNKYYPKLDVQGNGSINEAVKKYCTKSVADRIIDANNIKNIYNWLVDDYKGIVEDIAKDLDSISDSNKNIEKLVNMVISQQSSVKNESAFLLESFILEAPTQAQQMANNQQQSTVKSNPTPNSNAKTKEKVGKVTYEDNPEDEKNREARKNITKQVVTYSTAMTKIMMGKMNVMRDKHKLFMNCIKHAIKPAKETKTKADEGKANGEVDTKIKT